MDWIQNRFENCLSSIRLEQRGGTILSAMERNVKSRIKDETAELNEIWFEHFGSNYKTVIQPENESPPPIG